MNEREWFEQIYEQHADMLFRLGRHLLGAQDESVLYDLMQDTFLDAWSKRVKLMAHPNIGGWLTLSLKNRTLGMQQLSEIPASISRARKCIAAAIPPERF